jgi:hypothetical protein
MQGFQGGFSYLLPFRDLLDSNFANNANSVGVTGHAWGL